MLKDAQRHHFDAVMAWATDRLGHSLIDLLGTIQTLEACGVYLYLDQQSIDTTTPTGRLMFQITGAFAEFERSMIRQRVLAGLRRAVEKGFDTRQTEDQCRTRKAHPSSTARQKGHARNCAGPQSRDWYSAAG
jgi:DNA invertase Pin-like site-specific DNA recombinase